MQSSEGGIFRLSFQACGYTGDGNPFKLASTVQSDVVGSETCK